MMSEELTALDSEFAAKLKALDGDREENHMTADDLLCELLARLGFTQTVQAFGAVGKWYA